MSPWFVFVLLLVVVPLALGLGWALAKARHAEEALKAAKGQVRGADRGTGRLEVEARAKPAPPARPPAKPEAILVGTAANPVAMLIRVDRRTSARVAPVHLSPAARQLLAPLLQQAPRVLATSADLAAGVTKVVVKFSPEVARGLAAGTLEMTNVADGGGVRAIARDVVTKRFIEHAALTEAVNPVAVAAAVWQVAAIVTAQRFLADINARLANVERGISAIQDFLEGSLRAKLRTSVHRLREMADAVPDQRLSPRELDTLAHQLESIDREAQQITELYADQLAQGTREIASQDWRAAWSTDEEVKAAARVLSETAERSAAYLTSIEIRVVANTMRGAFGMTSQLAEARLAQVGADLDRHESLVSDFVTTVKDKLPTLSAKFQFDDTDEVHRRKIQHALHSSVEPMIAATRQIAEAVSKGAGNLRASAAELSSPQELEIELAMDGNIISAARRLTA